MLHTIVTIEVYFALIIFGNFAIMRLTKIQQNTEN